MNIFYFYDCPKLSAKAQPDKMLVKMPLETAQMLCTAHRILDGDEYADLMGLYKKASESSVYYLGSRSYCQLCVALCPLRCSQ